MLDENGLTVGPLRAAASAIDSHDDALGVDSWAERPFWRLVEELPLPWVISAADDSVLYANAYWRKLTGATVESLAELTVCDHYERAFGEEIAIQRRQVIARLTPERWRHAEDFLRPNNGVYVAVIYRAVFDSAGDLVMVSSVTVDRTKEHARDAERMRLNAALTASNRDLGDFVHIASHDLQEPLRKISVFSDRLVDRYGGELDDRGKDYLERISSASGRMQELIESLLAYSRVNSRSGDRYSVDLGDVVSVVLSDLEVAVEEAGAEVVVGELPAVMADGVQMRQLFQNLIGNALKFRRDDTPARVDVSAVCEESRVVVTVSDSGIGFDGEFADQIFAPFQRLHGRTEYEGSGIGLSVCRRIVERHGGAISASSTPGEGSTFTFTLPARASASASGADSGDGPER